MLIKRIFAVVLTSVLSCAVLAGSGNALIGWQTFETTPPGNNNTGIGDTTPDTNSTYDLSPTGNISASNYYLTGAIGAGASSLGRRGLGQARNSDFLNGNGFGAAPPSTTNGELIIDWTLADGSPGARIGPFVSPNDNSGSSWKFGNAGSANQLIGDVSITNNSSYYFRIEFIHYDARGLANVATSPNQLDLFYLAGDGTAFDHNLISKFTGVELANLKQMDATTWTVTEVKNISLAVGEPVGGQAFLAPGDSAGFRFIWSGDSSGQAQIDNLAFEGTFFQTDALVNAINPSDIDDGTNVPMLPTLLYWVFAGLLLIISGRKIALRR